MRFKKESKMGYVMFMRPNPSRRDCFMQCDCECGLKPAYHVHRAYSKKKRL